MMLVCIEFVIESVLHCRDVGHNNVLHLNSHTRHDYLNKQCTSKTNENGVLQNYNYFVENVHRWENKLTEIFF